MVKTPKSVPVPFLQGNGATGEVVSENNCRSAWSPKTAVFQHTILLEDDFAGSIAWAGQRLSAPLLRID